MARRRSATRAALAARREAQIRRAERALRAGSGDALDELRRLIMRQLRAGNYNPDVLSAQHPDWAAALEEHVLPEVTAAYIKALEADARAGTIDATAYAARHLDTVRNRLVGVADSVFDVVRSEVKVGQLQGEGIPVLAKRIREVMANEQMWKDRATTIARTEAIAANNAGARDAARYSAGELGHEPAAVVKSWLATMDNRVRETHAEADGQEVLGIDTPFSVGGYDLEQPGDPAGPAEEVVNCRCTVLYLMPGDPGYPESLAASGGTMTTTSTRRTMRAATARELLKRRPYAVDAPEAPPADAPPADPPADAPPGDTPPPGDQPGGSPSAATPPAPDKNGEVRWPVHGVLCPDGVKTGDGRKLVDVTWADCPQPLRAQMTEQIGHDDAVIVGRIESITKDGDLVTWTGTWDDETKNADAKEARRHNINGQMRGISIDADEGTISFEDGDGNPLDSEEMWDLGPDDEVVMVVTGARIRAATICMIPAYLEAYALDDTLPESEAPTDSESVTAAGVTRSGVAITAAALLADRDAPATAAASSAFAYPGEAALSYETGEPRGLTVTEDGRVFGYLATWGTCHIGIDGACVTPPRSETSYAYFLGGEYHTSDGQVVPVGQITMDTGHAGLELSPYAAMAHYDNTGTASADVMVGEDDRGIWFAGVVREDLPGAKRRALRAGGKTSGDWRRLGGSLELVAALAVNVPGFPIPKPASRVASGAPLSLVASGILSAPSVLETGEFSRAVGSAVERHLRRRELTGRLRSAKAATIRDRITRQREGAR